VAAAVARRKPGQSVELELVRHGRRLVLHLRLGAPAAVR
jgi:hypothetical protein